MWKVELAKSEYLDVNYVLYGDKIEYYVIDFSFLIKFCR